MDKMTELDVHEMEKVEGGCFVCDFAKYFCMLVEDAFGKGTLW